ncbi:hypothetical protein FA13DRAFT_1772193 [Coprinellus micaceus]|uniref:Uncharacterized protein n=1 Tax=Coprinellus micaceus TaxID=71717 RepID=A0A4Y7TL79_COPMI|nr:hypothetical protein FA13DRAFT_1772193 [Coprinellus micaceus]
MQPSADQFYSFTYPKSDSPSSTSATSSSSSARSLSTPPPPYTPEPRPTYREVKIHKEFEAQDPSEYPPLTTTKPMGNIGRVSEPTSRRASTRIHIAHPYSRLQAKKGEVKRRKIWNHALEKHIFSPYEISTLGAPHRRAIYTASLEAHIDDLHAQLLGFGFYPVPFNELDPYKGLNSKTAKSMVASLQHDASVSDLKLLELNRAIKELQDILKVNP